MLIIDGLLVDVMMMVMTVIVIVRGVVNKQNKTIIKLLIRYAFMLMSDKRPMYLLL